MSISDIDSGFRSDLKIRKQRYKLTYNQLLVFQLQNRVHFRVTWIASTEKVQRFCESPDPCNRTDTVTICCCFFNIINDIFLTTCTLKHLILCFQFFTASWFSASFTAPNLNFFYCFSKADYTYIFSKQLALVVHCSIYRLTTAYAVLSLHCKCAQGSGSTEIQKLKT